MKMNAEEILEKAKRDKVGMRAPGYANDKQFCEAQDMLTLLQANASPVELNVSTEGRYFHRVIYSGHTFVSSTQEYRGDFERSADRGQRFWV